MISGDRKPLIGNMVKKSCAAFSLVELLVVVVVMSILAALIITSTNRAAASARSAKCVSNLRTTGMAALNYFADRDGWLFDVGTWYCYPSWGPNGWVGMRDYLGVESDNLDAMSLEFKRDSVLTCPEMKRIHRKAYPYYLNMGFGMNFFLNANDPSPAHAWPNWRPLASSPRKVQNVPKLSGMWMFTDIAGSRLGRGGDFFSDISPHSESYMSFPHRGRQNVVFMDGHIESLTKDEWSNPKSMREFWGDVSRDN